MYRLAAMHSIIDRGSVSGVESCTDLFLGGHFLFTCSDIFAVGCIISHTAQRHRQTDNTMPIANQTEFDGHMK